MTTAENPVRVSRIEKGFSFSFDVDADAMEGQKKRSIFGRFEMFCDEPVEIGGDDSAPSPLAYFAASLAFCTLTQLARVAEVRKIELKNVRMKVTPTFDQVGSIVRDDVLSRVTDVQTVLEIDSPAHPEDVEKLVATAERMCFVKSAIEGSHQVHTTLRLNGQPPGA